MEASTFGQLIAIRRSGLNRTQEEIGKRVGVAAGTVSQWETGRMYPSRPNVAPLAAALDWTIQDLISATGLDINRLASAWNAGDAVRRQRAASAPAGGIYVSVAPQQAQAMAAIADALTAKISKIAIFELGHPTYLGKTPPGVDATFKAFVLTDDDETTEDDIALEWAVALTATHEGFARVNEYDALVYLREQKREWTVIEGALTVVNPELS